MEPNFEFVGYSNLCLIFKEISSRKEFKIHAMIGGVGAEENIFLRNGDYVLRPRSGNGWDLVNIRENRVVKEWVSLDVPIPGY